MEVITNPQQLDARLTNLEVGSKDYEKIAKAALKRQRKALAKRKTQRNAKSGHVNKFKLDIINDMFEKEPKGYAHTDSNGRKYYTCNGTTVRL